MNTQVRFIYYPSTLLIRLILILFISLVSLNAVASENISDESEPKALQRLYKCFDNKIFKLSKKKKRITVKKLFRQCDKRLDKWLVMLPDEAHASFMEQLEQNINLALEAAKRGEFVADEG